MTDKSSYYFAQDEQNLSGGYIVWVKLDLILYSLSLYYIMHIFFFLYNLMQIMKLGSIINPTQQNPS